VSRIDLTADVQGWTVKPQHLKRFHTRAKGVCLYDGTQRFTGISFGKRTLVARIYDKTVEIATSHKDWLPEVWSRSACYRAGAPVWRIEFQLRREALTSRARSSDGARLDTWEQVRSAIGTLWQGLTSSWISLRLPRTGKTRRRYARAWRPIIDEPFAGT
jgi:hypothetical protein